MGAELSLYCGQQMSVARQTTISDAGELFSTKAFASWKKHREHETKLTLAIIDRLDNVTKAITAQTKARR